VNSSEDGVARAFDLTGATATAGAPRAGSSQHAGEVPHDHIDPAGRECNQRAVGSISSHSCKKRKSGPPSAEMVHTENYKRCATRV
jgi:hypothetical protein